MSTANHLINVIFLAALCITVGHTCGHVALSPRFQLIGFTSTLHLGDTGVLGFTLACQAEFPGSRMCTSQEVMETTSLPESLAGDAWVRPVVTGDKYGAIDASGVRAEDLSCSGWSNANGSTAAGLIVSESGSIRVTPGCEDPRAVSCCWLLP
jgi:hypothetical protein